MKVKAKQGPGPLGGYPGQGADRVLRVSLATREGVARIVGRLKPVWGRTPTLTEAVAVAVKDYLRACRRRNAPAPTPVNGWDGPRGGLPRNTPPLHVSLETRSDLVAIKGVLLTKHGWEGSLGEIIALAVEHWNGGKA